MFLWIAFIFVYGAQSKVFVYASWRINNRFFKLNARGDSGSPGQSPGAARRADCIEDREQRRIVVGPAAKKNAVRVDPNLVRQTSTITTLGEVQLMTSALDPLRGIGALPLGCQSGVANRIDERKEVLGLAIIRWNAIHKKAVHEESALRGEAWGAAVREQLDGRSALTLRADGCLLARTSDNAEQEEKTEIARGDHDVLV